jgi:hypothetical protein
MNRISYRVMQRPETSDAARAFGIGRRSRSGPSAGGSGLSSGLVLSVVQVLVSPQEQD